MMFFSVYSYKIPQTLRHQVSNAVLLTLLWTSCIYKQTWNSSLLQKCCHCDVHHFHSLLSINRIVFEGSRDAWIKNEANVQIKTSQGTLSRKTALNYVQINGRFHMNDHVSSCPHEQQLHLDSRLTFQTGNDARAPVCGGTGCHMTEHTPVTPEEKVYRYISNAARGFHNCSSRPVLRHRWTRALLYQCCYCRQTSD